MVGGRGTICRRQPAYHRAWLPILVTAFVDSGSSSAGYSGLE